MRKVTSGSPLRNSGVTATPLERQNAGPFSYSRLISLYSPEVPDQFVSSSCSPVLSHDISKMYVEEVSKEITGKLQKQNAMYEEERLSLIHI